MLVIIIALAFVQYFTSDKLALGAPRREDRQPRPGAGAARHGRAPLRDGGSAEAEDRDDGHARAERLRDRPLAQARRRLRHDRPLAAARAEEIEGVLAHELSHIANRDVLTMTVASFFAMLAAFTHPLLPLAGHVRAAAAATTTTARRSG